MDIQKLRIDFLNLCHVIHKKGYVSGSGGNISCRTDEGFLITPTGKALGTMTDEDIIVLFEDGTYRGNGKPSKEYAMHLGCYKVRSDINVVIHVHSIFSVALSCLKNADPNCAMPIYTAGYGLRIGRLPLLPYMTSGSFMLAQAAAHVIGSRDSVLLANHGLITVGSDLGTAVNMVEEIEHNAQLHFILNGRGAPLSEAVIEKLIHK